MKIASLIDPSLMFVAGVLLLLAGFQFGRATAELESGAIRVVHEGGELRAREVLMLSPACAAVTLQDGSVVAVQGTVEVFK